MSRIYIPRSHLIAYGSLCLAQIAIGVHIVTGKIIIADIPVFVFLTIRYLISSVLLTLLCMALKTPVVSKEHPLGRLTKVDWLFLALQALMGGFLYNFFFFWGMEYTTVTAAGIICSTLPAIIVFCAFLFLGERLTWYKIIAMVFAMLGVVIVSMHHATAREVSVFRNIWGDVLVFLALIPEALYSIFNKFSGRRFVPLGSAAVVNWFIFLMLLPLGLIEYQDFYGPLLMLVWQLLVISAMTNVVFYWAWPKGLLVIPANSAAVFGVLVPVVASVLGWYFLHEVFGWHEALGMFFAFLALVFGIDWKHSPLPELIMPSHEPSASDE